MSQGTWLQAQGCCWEEKVCVAVSCIAAESRAEDKVLDNRQIHGSDPDHSPLMLRHSAFVAQPPTSQAEFTDLPGEAEHG